VSSLDITAFTNALNRLYPEGGLETAWYEPAPFAAWLPKRYDFGGLNKAVRPLIGAIRGSNDFAQALAAKSTPTIRDFTVTRVKTYVIGSIDNEALEASKGTKNASAEALKTQVDSALYEFGRAAARQTWNTSGGARGQISTGSTVGSATITLADIRDIVHFEIDMEVQADTVDGGGTVHPGFVTITAIDRDAGTLTISGDWNAAGNIPAVGTSDFLFRRGDYGTCLSGVLDWIPASAPTAGDSFFGVDRSVDTQRLAGSRVSAVGKSIEEAAFDAQARLAQNGGRADTLWLHTERWADLCKSIQAKVQYSPGGSGKVGFASFQIAGARGMVNVMADPNAPYQYALLTRKQAWELCGLGKIPRFSEEDGLKFQREASADAIEFRLKAYWQMICKRPIDNALIDLGTA
jgi:hypothetical protein